MGIDVLWDDSERTILRYDFEPEWTWVEFWEAIDESNAMMLSVPYTVDFIGNFSNGKLPSIGSFRILKRSREVSPDNLGLIVLVGMNDFIRVLLEVFTKIYPALGARMVAVHTLEEARALLAERHSIT